MNKFKLTILTLILLVFGLVVSGCVKKTQESNTNVVPAQAGIQEGEVDTSDWKTYRNEEYGFEFKYPINFEIFVDEDSGRTWNDRLGYYQKWTDKKLLSLAEIKNVKKEEHVFCTSGGPGTSVEGLSIKFSLSTDTNNNFDSIEDRCFANSEVGYCITKKDFIDDEPVIIIEDGMSLCSSYPVAIFIKNNMEYSLESVWWTQDKTKKEKYKNLFYQILETVRLD